MNLRLKIQCLTKIMISLITSWAKFLLLNRNFISINFNNQTKKL